jgi:triacylglycerol lipase
VKPELRQKIRAMGRELTPPLLDGTHALFTELHANVEPGAARVIEDLRYGPDERHRLDLFLPEAQASRAPVLVFVHGGGFIMGDKSLPNTPFYANVGRWAAANGCIGATMTYRLAPAHPWPAGAEDLALALRWLAEHAAEHGGDPARIFAMGQSAGAVHVASYLALKEAGTVAGPDPAGALLISGLYVIELADRNDFQRAYFGDDENLYAARSSLAALAAARTPLLFSVSEFDGDDFQRQAALVVTATARERNRYPRMLYLSGHNHLSSVLQIGLPGDSLGPEAAAFVHAVTAGTAV